MSLTRRLLMVLGLLTIVAVAAIAASAPTAGGAWRAAAAGKPVIGRPVTAPAQALAGKPFAVAFKVTRSDTGRPLLSGKMVCDPSVAGKVIGHTESFRAGTARLAFVVPTSAAGKLLKVKLTIKSGKWATTKVAGFHVEAAASKPALSIADATAAEGSTGTTTVSFPVTLSSASTQTVSVAFGTADGSATAPADYAAASGTLTFNPGEKVATVHVTVVGDTAIEQDEVFTVTLSDPVNATIADASASGTITNDDVKPAQVPITPGSYKGATSEGNYVFFTVTPNRTVTAFRVNDLPETCDPGTIRLTGGVNFGTSTFTIRDDGSFRAEGSWTGSQVYGDTEYTSWSARITGLFSGTSVTGTVLTTDELNYKGTHYRCSTADVRWTASLLG